MAAVAKSVRFEDPQSSPTALKPSEKVEVKLPSGRPGLLSSETSRVQASLPQPRSWDPDQLREFALDEAEKLLPQEVGNMLRGAEQLTEVAVMCDLEADASVEAVANGLALALVDVLWTPMAGCVPEVKGVEEMDVRGKLQLFWRCAVALCMMPTAQLSMMTNRKKQFLVDLESYLPAADASAAVTKLAYLRLNLPIFAMISQMPSEKKRERLAKIGASEKGIVPSDRGKQTEVEAKAPNRADATTDDVTEVSRDDAIETDKTETAAKHTYDVGYKKWEKFDLNKAMREADEKHIPKTQQVDVKAIQEQEAKLQAKYDFNDPVAALDQAIANMNEKKNEPDEMQAEVKTAEIKPSLDVDVDVSIVGWIPGASANIYGLQSIPGAKLNGQRVKLRDYIEADGRWRVVLADGSIKNIKPINLSAGPEATVSPAVSCDTPLHPSCSSKASANVTEMISESAESEAKPAKPAVKKGFLNAGKASDATVQKSEGELQWKWKNEEETVDIETAEAGDTTAPSLNQEYRKWDAFEEDEFDDVDDEVHHSELGDLDAMSGPQEEVARIKAHWKKETRQLKRNAPKVVPRKVDPTTRPDLPAGPVVERPCVYRPPSNEEVNTAKAVNRDYNKWKNFDADNAILELDNEDTTVEGNATRCSASKTSAMISCEGYTKDRDEFDLDTDIEKHTANLKKDLAQRAKDAVGFKMEGNNFLRNGRAKDACGAYQKGIDMMELCQQASVLMAESLAVKNGRLQADLYRNLAAAQLETGDYEGAKVSCDEALKRAQEREEDDDKARYRRATALVKLGQFEAARKDADKLASMLGDEDDVVKKLRASMPLGCVGPA